jgi:hypothetical protein
MTCARVLAEEDFAQGPGTLASAAGAEGRSIYVPGSVVQSKLPRISAYLTKHAGMYIDVCEQLVLFHMERGDTMSALITAEW